MKTTRHTRLQGVPSFGGDVVVHKVDLGVLPTMGDSAVAVRKVARYDAPTLKGGPATVAKIKLELPTIDPSQSVVRRPKT